MAAIMAGLNTAPIERLQRTKSFLSQKTVGYKSVIDSTMDSSRNFAVYKDILKTINPPCVPFFGGSIRLVGSLTLIHVGFYLSAFQFIHDGNKDFVPRPRSVGVPLSNSASFSSLGTSSGSAVPTITSSSVQPGSGSKSAFQPTIGTMTASRSDSLQSPIRTGEEDEKPLINFWKCSLSAEILRDIHQYQSQPYNLQVCGPVWTFIQKSLAEVVDDGEAMYKRSMELEPREREDERM
jgi:son of sevenless-like protein